MNKFALFLSALTVAACTDNGINIAKQGSFSVGGTVIRHEGVYDNAQFVGWAEQIETGQSYRADHAFVNYQIPTKANKYPLIFIHGYGGSGVCWEMTPDNRDGFATLMLKKKHPTYVMDLPGRGREGQPPKITLNRLPMKCFGLISGGSVYGRIITMAFSSPKIRNICRSSFAR